MPDVWQQQLPWKTTTTATNSNHSKKGRVTHHTAYTIPRKAKLFWGKNNIPFHSPIFIQCLHYKFTKLMMHSLLIFKTEALVSDREVHRDTLKTLEISELGGKRPTRSHNWSFSPMGCNVALADPIEMTQRACCWRQRGLVHADSLTHTLGVAALVQCYRSNTFLVNVGCLVNDRVVNHKCKMVLLLWKTVWQFLKA